MATLSDKIAIVTGGASGIGAAIVERFRAEGAVAVVLDLADGADARCDVTDQAAVDAAFDDVVATHGRLDLLVNSAGIAHVGTVATTSDADLDRVYEVNVKGVFHCLRAAVRVMGPGSAIVNLASIASVVGIPDRFAYSMSKGAVLTMTYSVATDFLDAGIRCNAISPARVHTPFVDRYIAESYPGREEEMFATLSATQPIGRMADPAEVAALAAFLCSDDAAFITGSNHLIDGGFTGIHRVNLDDVGAMALGCAPFGNLYEPVDDADVQGCVDAAWDVGIRLFDTAPLYGHGLSEQRLGAALRGRSRDDYLLSTKVGRILVPIADPAREPPTIFADVPPLRPTFDFSADGVLRSVEASLERLGVDRIDLLHVHDPDDHLDEAMAGACPQLERLRDEGVVRAIGLGTNSAWVAAHFLGRIDLDWLLLAGRCTLLDRSGPDEVFGRCVELGVRVLAAGVFNSGVLAAPGPDARFHYDRVPAEVLRRVERLAAVCARHDVPLAAAALQMPMRHEAVTSVLVGARTAAEIEEDDALRRIEIPDDLWRELADDG